MRRGQGRLLFSCWTCRKDYDCCVFSSLPPTRLPLATVVSALKYYYQRGAVPTLNQVAEHVARSASHSGAICRLIRRRRCLEMQLAEDWQASTGLSGDLEADGITLLRWKVRREGLSGSAGLSSFSKDLRPFIHMVEYTCTSCLRRTSSRIQSRQWKAWSA